MTRTAIIPYSPERTTQQDIECLRASLAGISPDVDLRAFNIAYTPLWLADNFTSQTVTVTLNNYFKPDIFDFIPGRQFFGKPLSKGQLLQDLIKADLPTPYSTSLKPGLTPTEDTFGPYITIKTMAPGTHQATGIFMCQTSQFDLLRAEILEQYQGDMERGYTPTVQQYVPTGPKPRHTSIITFLGSPIVCFSTTAPNRFDPEKASGLIGGDATSNFEQNKTEVLVNDVEMVDMAQRVAQAFPEVSVLGIDMVRCAETGKVYCLEVNLGNLAVLSAPICGTLRQNLGMQDMLKQFSAYDTMARRMVETLDETKTGSKQIRE